MSFPSELDLDHYNERKVNFGAKSVWINKYSLSEMDES